MEKVVNWIIIFFNNGIILAWRLDHKSMHGTFGCCVEGHGPAGTSGEGRMAGLDDPAGPLQPQRPYDSMIPQEKV